MVKNKYYDCGWLSYQFHGANTYASEWSQKGLNFITDFFGLLKVLRLWRASIWRVIWGEVLAWIILYSGLSGLYRLGLDQQQRVNFLGFCNYCESFASYISTPLSVAIGFFVSTIYSRWWEQWNTAIGWAEPLAYELLGLLPDSTDKQHIQRVTIVRWVQAAHALTYVDYCGCYRKEEGPYKRGDLFERGLLTKDEVAIIEKYGAKAPYDLPLTWCMNLLNQIEQDAKADPESVNISFPFQITRVRAEIQKNRACDAVQRGFDWIPVPVPQLQTISFAVYGYFMVNLFGRQFVMAEDASLPMVSAYAIASVDDYGFPFLSLIELVFYFGWLKSIALIFDPFADAGYAFNLIEMEEGIRGRIHTVFEAYRRPEECMPDLETDAKNVFGYEPDEKSGWGKMQLDEMKAKNTNHESVPQMHSKSPKPSAKDLVGQSL